MAVVEFMLDPSIPPQEGAPGVAIDPDPGNVRARRAYARAGFSGDAVVDAGHGPAVLMTFGG